jgi:hypothetical protein
MIGIRPTRDAHLIVTRSQTATAKQFPTQTLQQYLHVRSLIRFHATDHIVKTSPRQLKT